MALTLECAKHYMLCQRLSRCRSSPERTFAPTVRCFGVWPRKLNADAQELVSCVNLSIPMVFFSNNRAAACLGALLAVPLLPPTDEADANLDEYLPDGTPMTAVYRSLLLNLPT